MKRLLIGVLVLACLALIVFHAQEPMLYSAENTSSVGEVDLSVAEKMNPKKAEAVMPLLQDLIGQGGTVVLSVKVKDWESAEKELEEYAKMTRSMDNLVLSLDLSETDLDEFRKKSRENQDALTSLVNGTARLDHLKQLEITYRDSDDPSKYYSVVYEQEALREELKSSYTTYAENSDDLTEIGKHYEADTEGLKESVEEYGEVVEEIGDGAPVAPGIPAPQIGIDLAPAEAAYGEEVRWHGGLESGEEGVVVESYLDSRLFATTATGAGGEYAVSYRVEKVRAGPHLVYVQAGRAVSDLVTFTVLTSPSTLALGVTAEGEVATCSGTLTANDLGVAGAAVRIIVDDAVVARPATDTNGTYEVEVPLEAGEHRFRAEFTSEGYPLAPSASKEIRAQIGSSPFSPENLIPIAGGVAVGLLAGAIFLRWSRRRPVTPEDLETAHNTGEHTMTVEERAIQDMQVPKKPLTAAEAAFRLWDDLADAAGIEYGVKNARTRTPRELVKALKDTPGAGSAAAFVKVYERLRYAGDGCTWDDVEELDRLLGAFKDSRVP